MVNIKLDNQYRIVSDERQWILKKEGYSRDENIGYYVTIEMALEGYLDLKMRQSDATSVFGLMNYLKSLQTRLNTLLHPLNLRIVSK